MKTFVLFILMTSAAMAQQPSERHSVYDMLRETYAIPTNKLTQYQMKLRSMTPQQLYQEELSWQRIYNKQDQQERDIVARHARYFEELAKQRRMQELLYKEHIVKQKLGLPTGNINPRWIMGEEWHRKWEAIEARPKPDLKNVYGDYFSPGANGYYYGR